MRKDVLEILKKAEWMRRQVERVDECLGALTPEEAMVVACFMENNGNIMGIIEELGIPKTSAYRKIDVILLKIQNYLKDNAWE